MGSANFLGREDGLHRSLALRRGGRTAAAAVLAAAFVAAGCGGDGDSNEPRAELRSSDAASAQGPEPQRLGGESSSGQSGRHGGSSSGDDQGGKDATSEASPTDSNADASGPGRSSGSETQSGGERPQKKSKARKPQQPPVGGLPPQLAGKSVYEIARARCGDPQLLEIIPEEQRDNPEQLAEFARSYAPPGMEQEVYEGCLAGLHDLGL
jgi:hypothetical protein